MPVCASCGHDNSERAKFCQECAAPLAAYPPPAEQRKTVTVLFCDVTGSTALGESTDPEALRALLARYFERMKGIVESHGGTVEKFIGDAVMAVFGVPLLHEDDALRACRAAVEMRDALPELGVQARIGVNTGEVVTGTEERLATGDAVNVAARLEQAAQPGEILLGEATLALVRDAVEVEAVEPLELKGKAEPVPAYRLLAVHDEVARRRAETPFVGREPRARDGSGERSARTRRGALASSSPCSATRVSGKSRLAAEFLARSTRRSCAAVASPTAKGSPTGRWSRSSSSSTRCLGSGCGGAASLAARRDGRGDLGRRDRLGLPQAARGAGARAPLVCLFDDIHWGEETFLDLVEHVALLSTRRADPSSLPRAAGARASAAAAVAGRRCRLEPLRREPTVDALIPAASPDELRERDRARRRGKPALRRRDGRDGCGRRKATSPSRRTLQALLAARLDQLDQPERIRARARRGRGRALPPTARSRRSRAMAS